jgi:hypothetical protein
MEYSTLFIISFLFNFLIIFYNCIRVWEKEAESVAVWSEIFLILFCFIEGGEIGDGVILFIPMVPSYGTVFHIISTNEIIG